MASADVVTQAPAQVYENVRTIESQLKSCKIFSLPERYVWSAEAQENLVGVNSEAIAKEREDAKRLSIPVVDLAGIEGWSKEERGRIAAKLGKACEEWGFFQVVNTSVPKSVVDDLDAQAREFFELPVDQKEKAKEPPGKPLLGYGGRLHGLEAKVPWVEYLGEYYNPVPGVENIANQVWEGGNPKFCKSITEFCTSVEQLGLLLFELLAESLGLTKDIFSQHFNKSSNYMGSWRFNHYPPCPKASETMGQGPHCDPVALTVLSQDKVGGLQVRKGNTWVTVEPLPGAFIVNVGDILQAWSNDRFQSVQHRALVNENSNRLSIIYFFVPQPMLSIEAPSELIQDNQQSVYKPFTYAEFLASIMKSRVTGDFSKNALDYLRRETVDS